MNSMFGNAKFQSYLFIISLFTGLFLLPNSFAAAPVMHVVLAQKWLHLHEHYNEEQKRSFILGTLFPDIRYLKVISRGDTHEKGITVQKLLEKQTPFKKGKRLHAFVDIQRERFVIKRGMYRKLKNIPGQRHKTIFLKLLEDEILFSKKDLSDVRHYLTTVHEEERAFQIEDKMIEAWHKNQLMAFNHPPSEYLKAMGLLGKSFAGISPEVLTEWSKMLPTLAKDEQLQKYVDDMLCEFDQIMK